jgi:Tol biopolymer transport system component
MVDTDGQPKILDFGLARLLEERSGTGAATRTEVEAPTLTQDGVVLGTAAYMSPEQARGDAVDARTDVFSFGAMLYELVTATSAFARPTWVETIGAIIGAPTPSAGAENPQVPTELEAFLNKCMEKEADERFADAGELLVPLRQLPRERQAEEGAVPGTTPVGVRRGLREPPIPRALAWGIGIVLAGIVATTLWFVWRPTQRPGQPNVRRLTNQSPQAPIKISAISPDGEYLAYADRAGLHVMHIETGEIEQVQLPEDWSMGQELCWFPDGVRLLAGATRMDGEKRRFARLVLSLASRDFEIVRGRSVEMTIAPSGSLLAVGRPEEAGEDIWIRRIDGQEERKIKTALKWPAILAWSPDGQRIAYIAEGPDGSLTIESCDLQGQDTRSLLNDPQLHRRGNLNWLPDGRLIYVRSEARPRDWEANAWAVRVDPRTWSASGTPTRVTDFVASFGSWVTASADGKRLAALNMVRLLDVHFCELEEDGRTPRGPLQRLTFDQRHDKSPVWTPDGKSIVFMSNRAGSWKVARVDTRRQEHRLHVQSSGELEHLLAGVGLEKRQVGAHGSRG